MFTSLQCDELGPGPPGSGAGYGATLCCAVLFYSRIPLNICLAAGNGRLHKRSIIPGTARAAQPAKGKRRQGEGKTGHRQRHRRAGQDIEEQGKHTAVHRTQKKGVYWGRRWGGVASNKVELNINPAATHTHTYTHCAGLCGMFNKETVNTSGEFMTAAFFLPL